MKFLNAFLFFVAQASSAALADSKVDGLLTITPEWHAAIAAGECLTETGFGPCSVAETFGPATNGTVYRGTTEKTSLLLTQFNVYAEECQGAAGQENIDGWCAKRNAVQDQLAVEGVCMGDAGFHPCTTVATGEDLPIFGDWDCDGTVLTIDAQSYEGAPIQAIEKMDGDYLVTLEDGYRFALFEVTATSFTWYSPETGDTFGCRRD